MTARDLMEETPVDQDPDRLWKVRFSSSLFLESWLHAALPLSFRQEDLLWVKGLR